MTEGGARPLPLEIDSRSEEETREVGRRLASHLGPGLAALLRGPLGSGKTVLCRGIAEALGVDPARVRSPSFNILFSYEGRLPVHHIDLFRLEPGIAILEAGVEEALWDEEAAVLVEWAERLEAGALPPGLDIDIVGVGDETRRVRATWREGR